MRNEMGDHARQQLRNQRIWRSTVKKPFRTIYAEDNIDNKIDWNYQISITFWVQLLYTKTFVIHLYIANINELEKMKSK